MKINISDIRIAPTSNFNTFIVCVFGDLSEYLNKWVEYHNLEVIKSDKFNNILIPDNININDLFIDEIIYDYVDGFSPNLNKHLHIGHLSNLILAKSYQYLGIGKKFISILGDTLDGSVQKTDALLAYKNILEKYDYKVSDIFYASEVNYDGNLLKDGSEKYEGTKVFEFDDETKIVGIKSDGSTSYFYQDIALASLLEGNILYLTGNEQNNHFTYLKKIFPNTNHIGLGLVTSEGKVWSSRNGDVIFASDIFIQTESMFNNDSKLAYNILAGQILKSIPKSNKEIKMEQLSNPKTSFGLYLSYTSARMHSTGIIYDSITNFNSKQLDYIFKKSKITLNPSLLFNSLVDVCKEINNLYGKYSIKDDSTNSKYFIKLLQDLDLGMNKLGLYKIDKV